MGKRRLISLFVLAACGGSTPPPAAVSAPVAPRAPRVQFPPERAALTLPERVVFDFEQAVRTNKAAYVGLFDFAAVGEIEVLLHRYDINGRLPNMPEDVKEKFRQEDGTPYSVQREKRNVGNFYPFLAQRTVGTGGCTMREPRTRYAKLLGQPYPDLPAGSPPKYETLRTHANAWLAKGGVVAFECTGGEFGIAVVYTERPNARGYDLITIYDD